MPDPVQKILNISSNDVAKIQPRRLACSCCLPSQRHSSVSADVHGAAPAWETAPASGLLCSETTADAGGGGRTWFCPQDSKHTRVVMWRETQGQEAPPPRLDKFSASFGAFRKFGPPVAPKAMSCLVIKVFQSSRFCAPRLFMLRMTWLNGPRRLQSGETDCWTKQHSGPNGV